MTRFFHGGLPGLKLDDRLLPPTVTGVEHPLTATARDLGAPAEHAPSDRVYVTTSREVARVYAALKPDGALYEVLPVGDMTPDPDCDVPGVSWMCPAAVIVRIVDPVVLLRNRPIEAWMRLLNRATEAAGKEAAR